MDSNSIQQVIERLEDLFSKFNDYLFGGELQKPVITVSPDTKKGCYGWCTTYKAWQRDGQEEETGYYEINICADYLNRPFLEICETLIHEMVHLIQRQNDVKGTSRGGKYHNKRYKEAAEQHGLMVAKDEKYGWCRTTLAEETAAWIIAKLNTDKFNLSRVNLSTIKKPSKSARKYVCPSCGAIIRATKEVRVICADCEIEFEER